MKRAAVIRLMVLAALLMFLCQGCFLFPSPSPVGTEVPSSCRSGDALRDIRSIAHSITGLDALARIQITIRGRKQPWVRCALKWSHGPSGERMRVTGSGPFGITVFDALLRDNLFLLYVPSHEAVYFADMRQGMHNGTTGEEMSRMASRVRMVLNPWSALEVPDTSEMSCAEFPNAVHADQLCYISEGDGMIRSAFSSLSLSPYVLETERSMVQYAGRLEQQGRGLPCVMYPSSITVRLQDYALKLDIRVKEATFNTISPQQPAFDTLPFMSMRLLPLNMLVQGMR